MKKIIITGGAGFIGSHLIEKLLNRGVEDILVIDDLSTGKNSNIEKFSDFAEKEKVKKDKTSKILYILSHYILSFFRLNIFF